MNCIWLSLPPKLHQLTEHTKIVLSDIVFEDIDGITYINKRGFPTDGASIPYLLELIWNPFDMRVIRSVIQHDIQYVLHDFSPLFKQTRIQVDRRFLRSMHCENWEYSKLWYKGVRVFGQYIWCIKCKDADAITWYQATQQGEEAIDEWIKKCIENPRRLESVRYCEQIYRDKLRALVHICNDLRGFKLWLSSTDVNYVRV